MSITGWCDGAVGDRWPASPVVVGAAALLLLESDEPLPPDAAPAAGAGLTAAVDVDDDEDDVWYTMSRLPDRPPVSMLAMDDPPPPPPPLLPEDAVGVPLPPGPADGVDGALPLVTVLLADAAAPLELMPAMRPCIGLIALRRTLGSSGNTTSPHASRARRATPNDVPLPVPSSQRKSSHSLSWRSLDPRTLAK